jgi:hypothetical protein
VSLLQVPPRGSGLAVRFSLLEDIQGMSHFFPIVWTFLLTRFIIISRKDFLCFASLDCRQFKLWGCQGRSLYAGPWFGRDELSEIKWSSINDLFLCEFYESISPLELRAGFNS